MSELVIDLDSKVLLEAHLQCAAHEMPLMDDDEVYFGPNMKELCETRLVRDEEGWYVFHGLLVIWGRTQDTTFVFVQVSRAPEVSAIPG